MSKLVLSKMVSGYVKGELWAIAVVNTANRITFIAKDAFMDGPDDTSENNEWDYCPCVGDALGISFTTWRDALAAFSILVYGEVVSSTLIKEVEAALLDAAEPG